MSDQAKATDPAWFEEQVVNLLPDLLGGALSMAENEADAEDLLAQAVARAWERREDLREPARFRGWLFCIMRNCFLSRRRARQSRPPEVPLPEDSGDPSFSLFDRLHQPFLLWWGNPEQEFLNDLLKEDLQHAVDRLPEEFRTVVVLADVQGFRYAEIAQALEIPVGTVRSRLSRARARLQEELWIHAVDRGLRPPARKEAAGQERRGS